MSKWYYIAMGVFLVTMGLGMIYDSYAKEQCKVEALKAGKTADDINKICH